MNTIEPIWHLVTEHPGTIILALLGALAAIGGILMMLGTVWAFLDFLYRETLK
jgi:hypothetical protein